MFPDTLASAFLELFPAILTDAFPTYYPIAITQLYHQKQKLQSPFQCPDKSTEALKSRQLK